MKKTRNKLTQTINRLLLKLISLLVRKKPLAADKKKHEEVYEPKNIINAIDRFQNKSNDYIIIGVTTAVKKPRTIKKANLTLVHSV